MRELEIDIATFRTTAQPRFQTGEGSKKKRHRPCACLGKLAGSVRNHFRSLLGNNHRTGANALANAKAGERQGD